MSGIGDFFRRLSSQLPEVQEQEVGLNDLPTRETPLARPEKVTKKDKEERSRLLTEYFSRFPGVTSRLEKMHTAGLSNREISEKLVDDFARVQEQYFQLVSILPKNSRRLLPPFLKKDWETLDFQKFLDNNPFADEDSATRFFTRADNLSTLAFKIDAVINDLSIEEATTKAKKAAA
ncbi:MAG: hypothetical protein WC702_00655 [Patescibacteria group bacterium]|jgi:hypothetical protein